MPRRVSATEARVHFGELMRQVEETGQPVIVQRGGKDKVVVAPLTRSREPEPETKAAVDEPEWWPQVEKVRQMVKENLNGRELPDPAEVIRQMREERSEYLMEVLNEALSRGREPGSADSDEPAGSGD